MINLRIFPVVGIWLSLISGVAECVGLDDPNAYVEIFNTMPLVDQTAAAKSLEFSGLSSPIIFDLIEKSLLKYVHVAKDSNVDVQYVAWLTRALGCSGNEKYVSAIEYVQKKCFKK